ncbi:MAG: HPr family phosphocarrier protein [Bacillota bacterium]
MEYRADVTVVNQVGLHARPAANLVKEAMKYPAKIRIEAGDRKADAKSILQVLALGVKKDTTVTLVAEGERAEEALGALVTFIASGLGEGP